MGLLLKGMWLTTGDSMAGLFPSGSNRPTVILDPGNFFPLLLLLDSHLCKVVAGPSGKLPIVLLQLNLYPAEMLESASLPEDDKRDTPADPKCPDTLSPSALSPSTPSKETVTESPFERAIQQGAGPEACSL